MLAQSEHPVERNSRKVSRSFIDRNAVDDVAGDQVVQCPQKMLRGDAEHRGANAHAGIERHHFVIRKFLAEPIDQMNFGAHRPLRARRRCGDRLYDALGRADLVGGLGNLKAALRMNDYADARMLAAHAFDVAWGETLVDRAVALPQNYARSVNGLWGIPAEFLVRIPHNHLVQWNAHAKRRVAAKMLIREKQHFFAALV